MKISKRFSDESIYQLKVTLIDIKPPIWRRIQVYSGISLHKLHQILQVVMSWEDYHLYQFKVGRLNFGEPDPEYADWEIEMKNAKRAKLSQVAPKEKSKFIYEYDFGDGWEHEIVVEKILSVESGKSYPICIAGKRSCPPEDCGGVGGYTDLLEIIRDPEHEEYEDTMRWLGGEFDPEAFDIDEINRKLELIR